MTSDDFETMAMSVDPRTAQIFFRDKMYTAEGKLRVIAQEYMTNARDAHREVGRSDTPIEISLPTTLNPEFVVRDFGPGISPDRMKNVFRIYGATTKDKSNTENGGFGLGAKCGFSYANAFAVTSIHKGIKYVYSMYIDDNAMNQIATMYTGETTEPSGTEIKIPIRTEDMFKFTKWAHEVTQHWLPRPVFKGKQSEYREVEAALDHDTGWELRYMRNTSYISDRSGIWCLADDIPYWIPSEDAAACGEVVAKLHSALQGLNLAIVIPFKVGELGIYPSREILYYSDKTKHAIATRVGEVVTAIVSRLQARLDAATTLWDAVGLWWDSNPIVSLATKLEHPKFKGASLLRPYTPDEAGIAVTAVSVKMHGDRRCIGDIEPSNEVSFRYLFEPRSIKRKYIVDPSVGELSVKEMKKAIRDDGKGSCYLVKIVDAAKAAKFADYQGFIAAGYKPLQRPPKEARGSTRAEAVFIENVTVYAKAGTSPREKISTTHDRERTYFNEVKYRKFLKTRQSELLDDTKVTYGDCGPLGERTYSDALHIAALVGCMKTGLQDLRLASNSVKISVWAPRFAKHVDEDTVEFLPDWIEDLRLQVGQLDEKGWRRLVIAGYHRGDYVKAARWFWNDCMQTGENNAGRVRRDIKQILVDSKRFCTAFHDYVGATLRLEDDDGEDDTMQIIRQYTPLFDEMLGPAIADKAKATVAKIQSVGMEFESMFVAIPELPYLLEALMSTKLGENQRGLQDGVTLQAFIAKTVSDRYTASLQHSHINDTPVAEIAAEGTTAP